MPAVHGEDQQPRPCQVGLPNMHARQRLEPCLGLSKAGDGPASPPSPTDRKARAAGRSTVPAWGAWRLRTWKSKGMEMNPDSQSS